ncbi:MAG: DUF4190 domain-containing protein [Coriobacteriales bacterium]|nr:DUF4190 domain-containing protein [Coriobacteriales bacterium]
MSSTTGKQTSGLAIAGLVLGILAAVTSFLPIINNLSAFIAVIGGILAAISLVGALRGKHGGKGMAIVGVVLAVGSFAIVLATQSMYSKAIDNAVDKATSGEKPVASSADTASAKEEDASQADKSSKKDEPTEEKPAEEKPDYSNMKAGQTVTLENGLAITVNSFSRTTRSYSDEELVCANVTYTNNGDKSQSFNILDWKSENADGVQKSVEYNAGDDGQLESGKLKAGGTVTGNVYFEGDAAKVLYFSNVFQDESQVGWVVS